MPRTVPEGFREFHKRLTPSTVESAAAKRHRASIEACLKANFGLLRFFRSGSFGNGTSVRRFSDVDYFASLPTAELSTNSSSTLRRLSGALSARFPNTGVRVRTPAVVVPFGTDPAETTEVVPADLVDKSGGFHVYDIPDLGGAWRRAVPEGHNAYVTRLNKGLGYKAKPLIRFLKAWKYYRNVPISSFYLEMRAAHYLESESTIIYSLDLQRILRRLWDSQLASRQDPLGVAGYIDAASSPARKEDALSKLCTAMVRADKAREQEALGRIPDAFYWWRLLFNDAFPAYR